MAQVASAQQFPYVWEGTDKKGKRIKGKMLAVSEAAVKADLRRQGVLAKRVRKEMQIFKSGKKINAEDIALFARQLATMLQAGIPMVQCFDIIGNGHDKPSMQKLVLAIKSDVEAGTSLHEALAKHPLYFDDLFVNLVEAGEHAGALETLLDKVATYKEKTEALKKKIKKALFYPAAVLAVAVIVTIILLIFVIPQFESLFKGFGADLPAFTQMVINLSRFVQDAGLVDADTRGRRRLRVLLLQEALAQDAAVPRPHAAQGAGDRPDHGEGRDRPLLAHAVDHVRRRRAAGRGAHFRGGRDRQHRVRRCDAAHPRRSLDRPAPAALRWKRPACSRTW